MRAAAKYWQWYKKEERDQKQLTSLTLIHMRSYAKLQPLVQI
jgi:hypothetical protein